MEDIDVFFMDPTFIDLEVYCLWLKGFSGKRCDHGITQYFKKETCYGGLVVVLPAFTSMTHDQSANKFQSTARELLAFL